MEFKNLKVKKIKVGAGRGSVIFGDLSPTHGVLPITPLIDIPKGISSKMGLEVA